MAGRGSKQLAVALAVSLVSLCAFGAATAYTQEPGEGSQWTRVLLLKDYNTRVVVLGTLLLGVAAGVIGSFALLRKRALMGDALSHAMLPGIGLAFMYSVAMGGSGKSLPVLLAGAILSGLLGLAVILLIRNYTRLKEDTALGIVLSVFFGGGISLLAVAQRLGEGHSAGLESFIYGKTASMLSSDAWLMAGAAAVALGSSVLLFKEFQLLCFDSDYAASLGWRVVLLDSVMMGVVVLVTVVGLQAVGLILVVAMLIVPPSAARFWTERLSAMTMLSAVIGALSGMLGSVVSALFPDLPSGAMIVLVGTALFIVSMVFGTKRGLLVRWVRRRSLHRRVRRQHLLRAMFEGLERQRGNEGSGVARVAVMRARSWSAREFSRIVAHAQREGLVHETAHGGLALTQAGKIEAERVVRNHRLWELFLITHADIAPSHVDRDADAIEHVLGPDMTRELERLLLLERSEPGVPASPHAFAPVNGVGTSV